MDRIAVSLVADDRPGLLRDLAALVAGAGGNLTSVSVSVEGDARLHLEFDGLEAAPNLSRVAGVKEVRPVPTAASVFGKRVIVMGGGAQVAQVAMGAISEADRHNLRGERISVDTIALVGEDGLAEAVRAVARLPRAAMLVLAGSLMGGDIADAVRDLRAAGIPVISLNMAGSVPEAADLVVTDPVQAGVMAVMAVADTAKFSMDRVRGKRF